MLLRNAMLLRNHPDTNVQTIAKSICTQTLAEVKRDIESFNCFACQTTFGELIDVLAAPGNEEAFRVVEEAILARVHNKRLTITFSDLGAFWRSFNSLGKRGEVVCQAVQNKLVAHYKHEIDLINDSKDSAVNGILVDSREWPLYGQFQGNRLLCRRAC